MRCLNAVPLETRCYRSEKEAALDPSEWTKWKNGIRIIQQSVYICSRRIFYATIPVISYLALSYHALCIAY